MQKIQKLFNPETTDYYLVFTEGNFLLKDLFKKNFSHAYILTHDEYNWIKCNPCKLYMECSILPYTVKAGFPRKEVLPTDTVLKLSMYKRENSVHFGLFGLRSCISYVQYMLGLKLRCVTPYGLYRRLMRLSKKKRYQHGIANLTLIQ